MSLVDMLFTLNHEVKPDPVGNIFDEPLMVIPQDRFLLYALMNIKDLDTLVDSDLDEAEVIPMVINAIMFNAEVMYNLLATDQNFEEFKSNAAALTKRFAPIVPVFQLVWTQYLQDVQAGKREAGHRAPRVFTESRTCVAATKAIALATTYEEFKEYYQLFERELA